MSSHHFVKEGQEPALFILEAISLEVVEPLLEWVPFILVADIALENVLRWGIKVDVILQHGNTHQEIKEKVNNQIPVQILSCNGENFMTKGLQFLIENNNLAVNLIASPGVDFFKEAEKFVHQIQICVVGQNQKWSAVTSGKFQKWMPAGSKLAIRHDPVSPPHWQGLIQNGSTWETDRDGMVLIQAKSQFWIGEFD